MFFAWLQYQSIQQVYSNYTASILQLCCRYWEKRGVEMREKQVIDIPGACPYVYNSSSFLCRQESMLFSVNMEWIPAFARMTGYNNESTDVSSVLRHARTHVII
jgi:hypothetical protein